VGVRAYWEEYKSYLMNFGRSVDGPQLTFQYTRVCDECNPRSLTLFASRITILEILKSISEYLRNKDFALFRSALLTVSTIYFPEVHITCHKTMKNQIREMQ